MIIAPSIALTNKNFSPINFRADVLAFYRRKNTSRLIAIAAVCRRVFARKIAAAVRRHIIIRRT